MPSIVLDTKVEEVSSQGTRAICVLKATDPFHVALETLLKENIYGAPVYDEEKKQYLGFVDLVDVVAFIVKSVEGSPQLKDLQKLEVMQKCGELPALNPLHPVQKGDSLEKALKLFGTTKARRLPIMEGDQMVALLTRSAVISWLAKNLSSLGAIAKQTVKELNLGIKNVYSLPLTSPAIEAFKLMADHQVSGVAILNPEGTLLTALSAKDIKELQLESPLKMLYSSALEFVQSIRSRSLKEGAPVIACRPINTLEEVIGKLSFLRIHRIFVVDEKQKPIGVISVGDVLLKLIE